MRDSESGINAGSNRHSQEPAMKIRPFVVAAVVALTPLAAAAQDPPAGQQPPDRPGREQAAPEPRPYERVITKDAKSKEGVIITHRIKDKLYYEIPRAAIGREFLWVSQIARTTLGEGYGGQAAGNRVVRWERHDNRVLRSEERRVGKEWRSRWSAYR